MEIEPKSRWESYKPFPVKVGRKWLYLKKVVVIKTNNRLVTFDHSPPNKHSYSMTEQRFLHLFYPILKRVCCNTHEDENHRQDCKRLGSTLL